MAFCFVSKKTEALNPSINMEDRFLSLNETKQDTSRDRIAPLSAWQGKVWRLNMYCCNIKTW